MRWRNHARQRVRFSALATISNARPGGDSRSVPVARNGLTTVGDVRSHAPTLVADVERKEQIGGPARAREYDRRKENIGRHVGVFERQVDHAAAQFGPGRWRADYAGHSHEAERHDDDQEFRRLFDRRIDPLRPEQDEGHARERDPRPHPRLAPTGGADDQRLERPAAGARPTGENPAQHVQHNEQPSELARQPAEPGVDAFARGQGVAADFAVDPELEENAQQRGPRHAGAELGGVAGPDDQFAGPDREPDQDRPRAGELPETARFGRQVRGVKRGGHLETAVGRRAVSSGVPEWLLMFAAGGMTNAAEPAVGKRLRRRRDGPDTRRSIPPLWRRPFWCCG